MGNLFVNGEYVGQVVWWDVCPRYEPVVGDCVVMDRSYIGEDHFVTVVKDSGKREQFESGARRDTQEGKPEYGLIPTRFLKELALGLARLRDSDPDEYDLAVRGLALVPAAPLLADAALYQLGADKYGENNYQKGIPYSRVVESLLRHAFAVRDGKTDERHLAAVRWNAGAILYYEDQIARGNLPESLDDIGRQTAPPEGESPDGPDLTPEEVQQRNQQEEAKDAARYLLRNGPIRVRDFMTEMEKRGFRVTQALYAMREVGAVRWWPDGDKRAVGGLVVGYVRYAPENSEVLA